MIHSREILEQALQRSHRGLIVLDSDLRIRYWNRWIERHSGLHAGDVEGKTLETIFPDTRLGRLTTAARAALTLRQSAVLSHSINPTLLPLSYTNNASESEYMPHAMVVQPLIDEQGDRFCLIEISDISAARQREQLLRTQSNEFKELAAQFAQKEAMAKAVIENITDALVTVDSDRNIVDLNRAADTMFGCTPREAIGRDIAILFAAQVQPGKDNALPDNGEYLCRKRNGMLFPAEISVSTVEHLDSAERFVVVVRDLTERKQAEETLFREKEFAEITLQTIHEAVITTDENGFINSANQASCDLLRKEKADILERPLLNILTFNTIDQRHNAREALKFALNRGLNTQLPGSPELVFADGEILYIQGQISALYSTESTIIGCVVVLQDISLEKRMKEILSYQATHDELTDLINRREFERRTEDLLIRANADNAVSVMLYLDLDQFKLINDNCGHDAGDQLLRQLTGLLRADLRHTDTLARLGGDEFAALLPGCDESMGRMIAETLRETVKDYRFNWEGRNFAIGVSIGLVTIDSTYSDVTTVMKAADSACYIAKENGRDQTVVYRPEGDEEQRRRDEMNQASRIRESLENERFTLYCQPIVPIKGDQDQRWGIEVLVRMFDENGDVVPPMAFIPAAERYNLMTHIDLWVVDAVTEQWVQNPQLFAALDKVAINLSGQSLANDEFLEHVVQRIEHFKLPWKQICFEITETAAVSSIDKARAFMQKLAARGCRFALDDFGSGLSSFAYLKHLPVDYLKIDGTFVKDMLVDEIDAAMVRSISDIGRSMGLKTIAEFVENQEILGALRSAQVDFAQGYGICRPIPLAELRDCEPKIAANVYQLPR